MTARRHYGPKLRSMPKKNSLDIALCLLKSQRNLQSFLVSIPVTGRSAPACLSADLWASRSQFNSLAAAGTAAVAAGGRLTLVPSEINFTLKHTHNSHLSFAALRASAAARTRRRRTH